MDGSAFVSRPGTLFGEDFDLPDAAPEPEVIEPVFSASEVADARETAWREGNAAGLSEATHHDIAATRRAVEAIAASVAAECQAAAVRAEQTAEAIAGLLLDSLAATFPALCARYGDAEVRAVLRAVLPALTREEAITSGRIRSLPQRWRGSSRGWIPIWPRMCGRSNAMPCRGAMCASPGVMAARRGMPSDCGSKSPRYWCPPD